MNEKKTIKTYPHPDTPKDKYKTKKNKIFEKQKHEGLKIINAIKKSGLSECDILELKNILINIILENNE